MKSSGNIFSDLDNKIFNAIITGSYGIENFEIKLEKAIATGRIDIFIEFDLITDIKNKFRLIIENKVESLENNDQTERYYDYYKNANDAINIFLFLTPLNTEPVCNKFIEIDYQDLLDNIFEPALHQNINSYYELIIRDYIRSLTQPSVSNEMSERSIIMAIGKDERELLKEFWEKNENLIMVAARAKREEDPDDERLELVLKETKKRRPKLNFKDLGLEENSSIEFKAKAKDESIKVKIKPQNKVEYEGKDMTINAFLNGMLPPTWNGPSAQYFYYDGKNLSELYDKKYPKIN
jgi:hypothetical protein